ncbi:MAG: hypothetical protein P8Z75_15390, partial [Gammaproteobacteria bacterium]
VMAKTRSIYFCSACGAQASKWSGQCADCGAWKTLSETTAITSPRRGISSVGYAAAKHAIKFADARRNPLYVIRQDFV